MTQTLAKAILVRLTETAGSGTDAAPRFEPEDQGAFAVQFNPTTLRISRQNNIDRGASTTQTQRRRNPSSQPATMSFDLEFDTAEEPADGSATEPVDVRTKTLIIRQFAEPSKEHPNDPPPPIRFIWGSFVFQGIVTQLNEDLDYFAANGAPLRAKVSVTITEQNPEWQAMVVGAATRDLQSGGSGSGPGSRPASNPRTAGLAQGGESLQQLLSRFNADPATWRAAMAGLGSPLGLAAGAQVRLSANVSAAAGLGASGGFAAGGQLSGTAALAGALGVGAGVTAGAGLAAGVGLAAGGAAGAGIGASAGAGFGASAGGSAGAMGTLGAGGLSAGGGVTAGGEIAAGFALSAGGGIASSLNAVAVAQTGAASATARAAFDVGTGPGAAGGIGTVPGGSATGTATAAIALVDPRALSYGGGIPLRARADAAVAAGWPGSGDVITARAGAGQPLLTGSAGVAPWRELSAGAGDRAIADAQQRARDAAASTIRWMPGR